MNVDFPLEKLSAAEKIQIMESLWDSLCREADSIVSPPWHQEILAQRDDAVKSGTDQFEDWNTAKDSIRKQTP